MLRNCVAPRSALEWRMPKLSRRRDPEAREECWHVYYGDVHAGTIAIRAGIPYDQDPWEWSCGFYPGSHPGEHTNGTALTFDEARAGFEEVWKIFCLTEPMRIFRNGAINGTGPQRNTRCGMPASACLLTSGHRASRAASI
jgi:hypothetical protein